MAILPKLTRKNQTPQRQVSGTSYSADGVGGLKADDKELGSQHGIKILDPVPELGTRFQSRKTYVKMVRADASVRVSLRAGKAPVLGAEYFIDPFSNDPQDIEIAEFVEYNILEGMTSPFLKVMEQILHMYRDGFSAFEPCWELREWAPRKSNPGANRKKYTMLRKMAVRPAETITDFKYDDNGGPESVIQNAIDSKGNSKEVTIPIEKLVIFTFDQDGGDLQGNSILRSAYQHWFYKDHLYKIDAIQKERHGIGVPEVELQPGFDKEDKRLAHELAANLRTNEKAYIVRTTMMKIGFAEISTQLVDALKSAQHHDDMIMKNIMVQFLNNGIGGGSSGGRNTSATALDMFLKAMRYVANTICDNYNMYVIPQLVAYNYKTDRFPKLRVRNIGEAKDLQMWAAAMANLKKAGLIVIDDETEQWMRKQVDAPRRTSPWPGDTSIKVPTPPGETSKNGDKAATNGKTPQGRGPTSGNVGKSPGSGAV